MNETLAKVLAVALIGYAVIFASAEAAEVKPFVSASLIKVQKTDWYAYNDKHDQWENPTQMGTLKAGIVIRESGLSVDLNLFHISDPTNGRLGRLDEGDYGANGFEINVRKEF